MTPYIKRSLLGTRRVILSIITRDFFVIRNKQPIKSEPIECVLVETTIASTPCAFHENSRQLQEIAFVAFFDGCDTSCPIGKLPFSFLLCGEFLKTYFLSMPRSMQYFATACHEDTN